MYNSHRGMVPTAPNNRLSELLDQVRQEFENQQTRTGEYEQNCMFQIQLSGCFHMLVYVFKSKHVKNPFFIGLGFVLSWTSLALKMGQPLTDVYYLVANQLQEMEMVRQKVYNLEQTQITIKQR